MAWRWPWVKRATLEAVVEDEAKRRAEFLITMQAEFDEAKTELEARVQRQIDSNNEGVDILRTRLVKEAAEKVRLITECEIALRRGRVTRYVPGEGGVWNPMVVELTRSQMRTQDEQGGWIGVQFFVTPHMLTGRNDTAWLAEIISGEVHKKIMLALTGAESYERGARREY